MFLNLDFFSIIIMLTAISLGGFLKGVISFGLPLIALPILSLALPPKPAIFLLFFSLIFVNIREIKFTNIKNYQKVTPLLFGIFFGVILGSFIFHKVEGDFITKIIGLTIILFSVINYLGLKINSHLILKIYFSLLYGFFAGIIGGMTTIVGPLLLIYLVSLNLKKEVFSELVSLCLFCCLIPLYGMFFFYQNVTFHDLLISIIFSIPAVLMQFLGFKIRRVIPQTTFKNITLFTLIIIGFLVLYKSW